MNLAAISYEVRRTGVWTRLADYVELAKPRIAVLVLVCVAVAALSAGLPAGLTLFSTLLGTALVATSASAFNQWIERHSDALMPRTADRPLPSGRLSAGEVFSLGTATAIVGVIYLGLAVNWLAALLGFVTWFLYVCVYTPMKTRSVANTLVGAVAGAVPVLIGWAAAVGSNRWDFSGSGAKALTLFAIVFMWQFPHFMAIAWIYRAQYAAANMKMLPAVEGSGRRAGIQAVVWSALLIPLSLLPAVSASAGFYVTAMLLLGAGYLASSIAFCQRRDDQTARRLLLTSLMYLPAVLGLYMWAI